MTNEQYIAGSILIDEQAISLVQGLVVPSDFQEPECRAIFSAALALKAENKAIDPVSIRDQAKRNGVDLSVEILSQLMECVPTAANAAEYACRVSEAARVRSIKELATRVQEDDVSTPDELLAALQEGTLAILDGKSCRGLLTPTNSLQRFMDFTARAGEGKSNFVPSRFPLLDGILGGGFIKSGLYIIGARPAVGKSSFAVNLADTIKGNVLMVSLEMSPEQITAKRFSRATGIPTGKLLSGKLTDEEWNKVGSASSRLFSSGVFLNSSYGLMVQEIQSLAQSVPDLQAIIIDYLGLIQPATRGGSTYENVSAISRELKRMALSLNVPVICLSQLSRTVESREDKRPRLSDLRDSGAIEQDADAVMFLYRQDYYTGVSSEVSTVQLSVAKNRHGAIGTVNFAFYRSLSGFKEVP